MLPRLDHLCINEIAMNNLGSEDNAALAKIGVLEFEEPGELV